MEYEGAELEQSLTVNMSYPRFLFKNLRHGHHLSPRSKLAGFNLFTHAVVFSSLHFVKGVSNTLFLSWLVGFVHSQFKINFLFSKRQEISKHLAAKQEKVLSQQQGR